MARRPTGQTAESFLSGSDKRWAVAAAVLCAVGAILRILVYAEQRSLWFDEAALALNIVGRGFAGLLRPLDNLQAAPPLFLWLSRVAVLIGGENEWTLRLLPLVAGIASAPLMWRVARRILDPIPALFAVGLIALSPPLVHHAAEAKPYAVDTFVSLVLLDRALAVSRTLASPAAWWTLGMAGAVALTLSTPAPFVLAGVGTFLLIESVKNRDAASVRRSLTVAASWVAVMLALVATVFRPLVGEQSEIGRFMHWYWATNFLTPDPPGLPAKISALVWSVLTDTFLGGSAPRGATTMLAVMVALGVAVLVIDRRRAVVVLLAIPALCIVVASALRIYPLAQRLALFLVPMSAIVVAASLGAARWLGRRGNGIAGVAAVVFLLIAARGARQQLGLSGGKPEARELVREVSEMHAQGMPVWLSGGGSPAWRFYTGTRTMLQRPRATNFTTSVGGAITKSILIGAWYNAMPERLGATSDDIAGLSRPSAWSATEASRIRELARPCAVLFISFIQPGEPQALLASSATLGGRVVMRREGYDTQVYQVCFDRG
jgi:hypothetical protein